MHTIKVFIHSAIHIHVVNKNINFINVQIIYLTIYLVTGIVSFIHTLSFKQLLDDAAKFCIYTFTRFVFSVVRSWSALRLLPPAVV